MSQTYSKPAHAVPVASARPRPSTVRSDEWPAWFSFWFSGCWRALAKGTAWAGFYCVILLLLLASARPDQNQKAMASQPGPEGPWPTGARWRVLTAMFAGGTVMFTRVTVMSVVATVVFVAADANPAFLGARRLCTRENAVFVRKSRFLLENHEFSRLRPATSLILRNASHICGHCHNAR